MRVHRDRQRHGQIALIPQQALVKALDHQHEGHHRNGKETEAEDHQRHDIQHMEKGHVLHARKAPNREAGQHRDQQLRRDERQYDAARGAKFMLQKLA